MDGLLPKHVSRWVLDVDAESGGDGLCSSGVGVNSDAAWGRVLSGVFVARVLAAEEAMQPEPVAMPSGLLVHARSNNACFYNWTRVVFPQLERSGVLELTPAVKSGALSGDPLALAALVKQLYAAVTHKPAAKVERNNSNTTSPTSLLQRPKLSRLDRLNRLMSRSQKRADGQQLLQDRLASTSPPSALGLAQRNHTKARRRDRHPFTKPRQIVPDDIAYVTDREVDALDASVKELLRRSRAEHDENFEKMMQSKTTTLAATEDQDRRGRIDSPDPEKLINSTTRAPARSKKSVQKKSARQNKLNTRRNKSTRKPRRDKQQRQHEASPTVMATSASASPPLLPSPTLEMARQKVSLLPRLVHRSRIATYNNNNSDNNLLHHSSSSSKELAAKLDLVERTMLRPPSAAASDASSRVDEVDDLAMFANGHVRADTGDTSSISARRKRKQATGQPARADQHSQLPTLSQLAQLQKDCLVQPHSVASANKIVSCITAAFSVLECLVNMPIQNDTAEGNDDDSDEEEEEDDDDGGGGGNDKAFINRGRIRRGRITCSAKDAPDLFSTLGTAYLLFRGATNGGNVPAPLEHSVDLIRSHIAINMTSLLQRRIAEHARKNASNRRGNIKTGRKRCDARFQKGAPPRLMPRRSIASSPQGRTNHLCDAYLPLDDLAEQLCEAIETAGRAKWWKTLAEDLRLLDALLEHPNLSLSTILRACDLLSELWLTDVQWCRPAGDMLALTVVRYLSFRTMKMWVLRLANVALGMYVKDAKHILSTGRVPHPKVKHSRKAGSGGTTAAQGVGLVASNGDTLSQRQLRILEFCVRVLCCNGKGSVRWLSLAMQQDADAGAGTHHRLREALDRRRVAVPGAAIRRELGSVILSALETLERVCEEHRESLAQELRNMGVLGVVAEVDASEFFLETTEENRPACVKRLGVIAGWIGSGGGLEVGERLMQTISDGCYASEERGLLDRALREVESRGSDLLSDMSTPMGTTPRGTPTIRTLPTGTLALSARSDIRIGRAATQDDIITDHTRYQDSPLPTGRTLPAQTVAASTTSAEKALLLREVSPPPLDRPASPASPSLPAGRRVLREGSPPPEHPPSPATRLKRIRARLFRYLSEVVFPSFGLEAQTDRLDSESFRVLLDDVLPRDHAMTLVEARRFFGYVDKSGTESISPGVLVRFMSAGLLLDNAKRAAYGRKSSIHSKIMKFLEEMWACSLVLGTTDT